MNGIMNLLLLISVIVLSSASVSIEEYIFKYFKANPDKRGGYSAVPDAAEFDWDRGNKYEIPKPRTKAEAYVISKPFKGATAKMKLYCTSEDPPGPTWVIRIGHRADAPEDIHNDKGSTTWEVRESISTTFGSRGNIYPSHAHISWVGKGEWIDIIHMNGDVLQIPANTVKYLERFWLDFFETLKVPEISADDTAAIDITDAHGIHRTVFLRDIRAFAGKQSIYVKKRGFKAKSPLTDRDREAFPRADYPEMYLPMTDLLRHLQNMDMLNTIRNGIGLFDTEDGQEWQKVVDAAHNGNIEFSDNHMDRLGPLMTKLYFGAYPIPEDRADFDHANAVDFLTIFELVKILQPVHNVLNELQRRTTGMVMKRPLGGYTWLLPDYNPGWTNAPPLHVAGGGLDYYDTYDGYNEDFESELKRDIKQETQHLMRLRNEVQRLRNHHMNRKKQKFNHLYN